MAIDSANNSKLKKCLCFIAFFILAIASINCVAQTYQVTGNVYSTKSSKTKVEGKKTPYVYEARDGQKYDIYILPDGRCYTNRTSSTTGKQYRAYLKEDMSKDIAKKVGIVYSYVKKSKKK